MQGKAHRPGPGRNHMQNPRNTHIPNETQLRNQQGFPVQAVMMQGQRQGPYIGHPMAMAPRSMRPNRAMYSSSPQGHSPMQGYIQQQNMQYQVVGQDHYGQPVMRPAYIPNVQQAYQMQATTAPFQPQYIQQQPQYFNQGMPQAMYYTVQPNQPMQQPQQPTQTSNPAIQTKNLNKPKPKRTSKIVIRDPKDNKYVTEQILSHSSTANSRSGGTPPLKGKSEFTTTYAQM